MTRLKDLPEVEALPLTRVRRGYWRNKWKRGNAPAHLCEHNEDTDLCTTLPDGTWLGAGHWETRAAAEKRALADLAFNAGEVARVGYPGVTIYEWLGPVFFKDKTPA